MKYVDMHGKIILEYLNIKMNSDYYVRDSWRFDIKSKTSISSKMCYSLSPERINREVCRHTMHGRIMLEYLNSKMNSDYQ